MSIKLITGVPRAGKTYYCVNHIVKTYYDYNSTNETYKLKEKFSDLKIITNIENLELDHINLDHAMKEAQLPFNLFFTKNYQDKIHLKYPKIIYIIDECQRYLGRKFYDKDTIFYFDYHGHYGDDIYLITQHFRKLCIDISTLAEFEVRAVKRTLSLMGEFKYCLLSDGDVFGHEVLKPKKQIFELYQSQTGTETEKIKKPFLKYLIVPALGFIISGYLLIKHFTNVEASPRPATPTETSTPTLNSGKSLPGHPAVKAPTLNHDKVQYQLTGSITLKNKLAYVVDHRNDRLTHITNYPYPVTYDNLTRSTWATIPKSELPESSASAERERERWEKAPYVAP